MAGKRKGDFSPPGASKRGKQPSVSSSEEDDVPQPSSEKVLEKLQKAAPFYFFLSRVEDKPETHNEELSITFPELLCLSETGKLEQSVHFTMKLDAAWLKAQYAVAGIEDPKIDVYYEVTDPVSDDGVNHFHVKSTGYQCHNTKMSLLFYEDGSARVIICTGNLLPSNWQNKTQGVWVSPLLPKMEEEGGNEKLEGDSKTNFRTDLIDYLKCYNEDSLNIYIERLKKVNMSSVMVCFIASVPANSKSKNQEIHQEKNYGHGKLRNLLEEHVANTDADWEIIAQCTSFGSLGKAPEDWLLGEFALALNPNCAKGGSPPFSLIYPSQANVQASSEGILGGEFLFYNEDEHNKQDWIERFLQQWKSDGRHRTEAMPHINTYAQVSPDRKSAKWFLLSSASTTKAAWGKKNNLGLQKWNYEAGVLFLPKFLTGESNFGVRERRESSNQGFPFPYDLQLTPYNPELDKPFFSE